MEPLRLDADGRKANALHLGILLRLQIVALRRKWLQAVSITFGEARASQPLPETCAGVVEQVVLRVPEKDASTSALGQYQPLSIQPAQRLLTARSGHSDTDCDLRAPTQFNDLS